MTWFDWTISAWLALSALATIALIGKPRKPLDPGDAALAVVINSLLIIGVVMVR